MEAIERNFGGLGWELFAAEYLGHFGDEHGTTTAITAAAWKKGKQEGPVPEGIRSGSVSVSVSPDGSNAAIAVAWHVTHAGDLATAAWELDGITEHVPRIGVKIIHASTHGVERALLLAARSLRSPIVYDHGNSATRATIERMLKTARPRPVIMPRQLADVRVAHAQLIKALERGEVYHWEQPQLDRAATSAVLQTVGQGALIRSPKGAGLNVTPLEAVALALDVLPALPRADLSPDSVIDFG
jgi:hypothetical protein